MELDLREVGDVTILVLEGGLTTGMGDEQLRDALDTLVKSKRIRILLDCSGVTYMDSSGMGELVAGFRVVEQLGGQLKILSPSRRVHNSLSISKLLPIFEVFDDEQTALASFASDPGD